jgi:hypothetical protein
MCRELNSPGIFIAVKIFFEILYKKAGKNDVCSRLVYRKIFERNVKK